MLSQYKAHTTHTHTAALNEASSGIDAQVKGRTVSLLTMFCLCLALLCFPDMIDGLLFQGARHTIEKDRLEKR